MKLHEYFDCNSQDELRYKLNHHDSTVAELEDFYNYKKAKDHTLDSPTAVIDFIEQHNIDTYALAHPNKDIALMTNHKHEFVAMTEIRNEKELARALQATPEAENFIIINSYEDAFYSDVCDAMHVNCLDYIRVSENTYATSAEGTMHPRHPDRAKRLTTYEEAKETLNTAVKRSQLYDLDGAREFTQSYFSEQTKGLHVYRDEERIRSLLQQAYQHEPVENVVVLTYDTENRVQDVRKVALGHQTQASVSSREVFKDAMKESAKGVIVMHNHPSGHPDPSKADIRLTEALITHSKLLDKDMYDHFVVGSKGTASLFQTMGIERPRETEPTKEVNVPTKKTMKVNFHRPTTSNELSR
ncbi:JAB domain-containing protein [Veillonella magna]|uniref:JAB domain-containing protein n=1 Tax=Veillonella magna TaxID=464322 RepID=A0ABS2GCL3_9FIRM|nr:JAB domain-containing protein [Veillonella magna]MBM6823547.1 JAB domain-containing protein [Veillonella magna]MBM6911891.1 JAB domain-containing protein [Veillonella magna]